MAKERDIKSLGEMGVNLAKGIKRKDVRHNRFWNSKPFPVFLDNGTGEGYWQTKKQVKASFGSNQSGKTVNSLLEAVMIYTGIVPPAFQGVYAWEDKLNALVSGPNKRARYVRIVVMDYGKHFNVAIRPKLTDPDLGFLPEAWDDYDPVHHQYHGPDGSILDIFSADPAQDVDPMKLRGGRIDHTWIDEINRPAVYTESVARGAAATKDSMATVSLSYCPQNGLDWTFKTFHNACYEKKGDRSYLKPAEEQSEYIHVTKVCMKDNPYISDAEYMRQWNSYRDWERAFRVDGEYSERTSDAYFRVEPLIVWEGENRCSPGVPAIVHEVEADPELGIFTGNMEFLESWRLTQENQRYDERFFPVWRIWEKPRDGEKYIMTADIGEGNPKSDPHSVDIYRCTDQDFPKQVAHLHITQYKPGELAIQACCMGNVYGNCLLVPESNNTGGGMFLDRARRYQNMYTRIEISTQEDKPLEKTGWFTSKHNKGAMLGNAYKLLQQHNVARVPSGELDEHGMEIMKNYCPFNSRVTLGEFISYQEKVERDKNEIAKVTWGAAKSAHDDCTMSTVIAWKVIRDEFNKISSCKMKKKPVRIKKDEHYLGPKQKKRSSSFSGLRKQSSLKNLRRSRGARNGR
jgi:hypothetical protein